MKRFELSELGEKAHIHFIGIGGISMSGLADIMIDAGHFVSGSDRTESDIINKLKAKGARVYQGHSAENVAGADLVVHTSAVHEDNPEMAEALRLGIRRIDRAEFLGAVMKGYKKSIGVAGTHGKTTTTSMLAHALIYTGNDPTVSVGGELDIIGGNIKSGKSEYFLTEACEYTNSFLKFFPNVAVITNIEADHLDFFKDIDDIIESFRKFALLTKDDGCVIAWGEDEKIRKALDGTGCKVLYYGMTPEYDFYAANVVYKSGYPEFDVMHEGKKICHVELSVPGEHNILNALASVAVCTVYGIDAETAAHGIETYKGTHRRFEKMGDLNGAAVIADYAHHPTEIRATLKTAAKFNSKKIWCVFQPHTYSRTRTLWNDFLTCFDEADELILAEIYAARETPDGVTTSAKLADAIAEGGKNARFIDSFEGIAEFLRANVSSNEMVFLMGAGDVINISELIV